MNGLQSASPTGAQDLTQLIGEVIESPAIDNGPLVWPPAIGWWIITALLIIVCIVIVIKTRQYLQKRAEYRFLNNALESLSAPDSSASPDEKAEFIRQLNRALKAISIQKYGAAQVAALSGKAWLQFLDQSGQCNHFSQGAGQVFGVGLYQKSLPNEPDLEHLKELCEQWCKEVCQ